MGYALQHRVRCQPWRCYLFRKCHPPLRESKTKHLKDTFSLVFSWWVKIKTRLRSLIIGVLGFIPAINVLFAYHDNNFSSDVLSHNDFVSKCASTSFDKEKCCSWKVYFRWWVRNCCFIASIVGFWNVQFTDGFSSIRNRSKVSEFTFDGVLLS